MLIFIVSILLGSFITASGGVLTLILYAFIDKEFLLNAWTGWFLGDFIGFLLLTPVLISLTIQDKKPNNVYR